MIRIDEDSLKQSNTIGLVLRFPHTHVNERRLRKLVESLERELVGAEGNMAGYDNRVGDIVWYIP